MHGQPAAHFRETEMPLTMAEAKKLAVIGAGPAGGLCHYRQPRPSGDCSTPPIRSAPIQHRRQIPGKEEFHETLRYFRRQLALREVTVGLGVKVEAADLSGIRRSDPRLRHRCRVPRTSPASATPKVLSYLDVLRDKNRSASGWRSSAPAASASTPPSTSASTAVSSSPGSGGIQREWGGRLEQRGGLAAQGRTAPRHARIYLLQRKTSRWAKARGKPPVGSTAPA